MFDNIRKTVAPTSFQTELTEIREKLVLLDAEREEHRLLAGQMVVNQGYGFDSQREMKIRAEHAKVREIDEETTALRERRSVLEELLKPEPEAKKALVDLPMSPELVAVIEDLENARSLRQRLIASDWDGKNEGKMRQRANKIAAAEEQIEELRQRREVLLQPYNVALTEALSPYVRKSASKLNDAANAFLDAMRELREINSMMPAARYIGATGLEPLIGLGTRDSLAAIEFCKTILDRNPEVPFLQAAE